MNDFVIFWAFSALREKSFRPYRAESVKRAEMTCTLVPDNSIKIEEPFFQEDSAYTSTEVGITWVSENFFI